MPKVRYEIDADARGFKAGFAQAKQEARDFAADLKSRLGGVGDIIGSMGPAGVAAAAALGGVTIAAKAAADAVADLVKVSGDLNDMAARSGVGVEALQEFGYAAKLTGTSVESFVGALRVMQVNLVDNEEKFRRLGVSVADLRGLKPEEQFLEVAEAIRKIQDPADQTAAAISVFGRNAVTILPAIKEGLAGLSDEAKDLSIVLGQDTVNAADALGDEATKMGLAWEGVKNQLAAVIVENPELIGLLKDMTSAIGEVAGIIKENKDVFKLFMDFMGVGATQLNGARVAIGMARQQANLGLAALGVEGPLPTVRTPTGFGGGPSGAADINARAMAEASKSVDKQLAEARRLAGEQERLAKDAAAKIKRIEDEKIKAMADAMKSAQKAQEQFYADQEKLASEAGEKVLKDLLARQKAEEEARDIMDSDIAASQAEVNEMLAAAEANTVNWSAALQDVANQFSAMGGAGGFVASIAGGIAGIAAQVQRLKTSVAQGGLAGAGGLGGLLGKLGAGLGIAGAAFGIGKAIFGGIKGLFGGDKEAEKKREEERKRVLDESITKLQGLQQRLEKFRMDKLQEAVGGTASMFMNLANTAGVSQERMERVGRLGAATFAALKAEGLSTVDAIEAMGPAFDAALEAVAKTGLELPAAMAEFAQFRQLVLDNKELVAAAEGIGQVVTGLLATGNLTQQTMADVSAEVGDIFGQLQEEGFNANQALAALAPSLFAIQQAAKDGKIAVDEETQALIDQAEAAGLFENMSDPMQEMVEIQKLMLETTAALAKVFGAVLPAEVQKYIDKLNQVPAVGVPGAAGGDVTTGNAPMEQRIAAGDYTSAASGFGPKKLTRDTMFLAHKGEHVAIVPAGVAAKSAAGGFGESQAGISFSPVVQLSVDTHGEAKSRQKFIEDIQQAAYEGIMAGKSPILKALQDRGSIRR